MHNEDKIVCLVDGCMGIYLPQCFVIDFSHLFQVKEKDEDEYQQSCQDCLSQDLDTTDDSWQWILDNVSMPDNRDPQHSWSLYQDGDLFAVRDDYEWID